MLFHSVSHYGASYGKEDWKEESSKHSKIIFNIEILICFSRVHLLPCFFINLPTVFLNITQITVSLNCPLRLVQFIYFSTTYDVLNTILKKQKVRINLPSQGAYSVAQKS